LELRVNEQIDIKGIRAEADASQRTVEDPPYNLNKDVADARWF